MSEEVGKIERRRVKSNYITVIISVSLVLFMLGLLGLLVIHAKKLGDYFKENIVLTVFIKDDVKDFEIKQLKESLASNINIRSVSFVTKDQAAEQLKKDLGEDFISFLGANPLNSSLELRLKADFATTINIEKLEADLMLNPLVKEVYYQKSLVEFINENIKKISLFVFGFCGVLIIISLSLINNSIRLAIYSKRFLIKTMQLVGATQHFIRVPFILRSIKHGVIGGLVACALLAGVLYTLLEKIPELRALQDYTLLGILFGAIFVTGILITWISTYFAVRKYLRLKTDDLYY